MYLKTVF